MKAKFANLVVLGLAVLLTACGGGGSSNGTVSDGMDEGGDPTTFGLLKPAESAAELERNLRSGLQDATYVSAPQESISLPVQQPSTGVPGSDSSSGAAGNGFSQTTLQESGVDEADLVKYDGEILYVVDTREQNFFALLDDKPMAAELDAAPSQSPPEPPVIRLFRTNPAVPSTEALAELALVSPKYAIDGLYLAQLDAKKQLIAVGQTSVFSYWGAFASDYYWREGKTLVQTWDVNDAATPSLAWSLELEGTLLASRRIENTLYLVTRYSPAIEGLKAYPQSVKEVAANKTVIDETPIESLLPNLQRDNGAPAELLAPTDCYVPNADYDALDAPPASGSLVTVTAIDLESPDTVRSICLNTYASGFYVSSAALYVTANGADDATLIHKVALPASGPEYRGSGEVRGYLGTSNPAFLMSEKDGNLRVVSSTWGDRIFPLPTIEPIVDTPVDAATEQNEEFGRHRLTILRESVDGTRLQEIAHLPNAARPQPIGKPDEDLYAARFLGDRAYLVTFRVIDPLYVLNLEDAQDPQITGELEIPGYSTVLQPVGDNLLLGIGMEVPENGPNVTQGVKLALFDVADIAAPVSVAQVVVGKRGSHSPAQYDYHALTLLEVAGKYRAALPILRNEKLQDQNLETSDPWYYYGWSDSGLYLFDIDPVGGSLTLSNSLVVEQSSAEHPYSYTDLYRSRSVLHNDAVFFIDRGVVWSTFWQ